MNILAVIPARGGSKGVPGKNIRPVCGKPLIGYTIEAALGCGVLSRIVVSSDDEEILEIALSYPGVIARKRPAELASDTSSITPVIRHVLEEEERKSSQRVDAIMLLQPTSPIREPWHIAEALSKLAIGVNSVISVCEMQDLNPARMYRMEEFGLLSPIAPDFENSRRQDIPPAYYRNGSIYLVRRDAFEARGSVMAKPAVGYIMSNRYLLNIDEVRDMIIAEALISAWLDGRL